MDIDDLVVALGGRFSPATQTTPCELAVRIGDTEEAVAELRLEAEWVRVFAPTGIADAGERELHEALRVNEGLYLVRYGIEEGALVLRADLPIRLFRAAELVAALTEIQELLRRRAAS